MSVCHAKKEDWPNCNSTGMLHTWLVRIKDGIRIQDSGEHERWNTSRAWAPTSQIHEVVPPNKVEPNNAVKEVAHFVMHTIPLRESSQIVHEPWT